MVALGWILLLNKNSNLLFLILPKQDKLESKSVGKLMGFNTLKNIFINH